MCKLLNSSVKKIFTLFIFWDKWCFKLLCEKLQLLFLISSCRNSLIFCHLPVCTKNVRHSKVYLYFWPQLYIDDCCGTASCSRGELQQFINYVNNFHPALQFTWVISETNVLFLHILYTINGNRLATSVFYKPTDSHSYLLYSSYNPNYTNGAHITLSSTSLQWKWRLSSQMFGNERLFCPTWLSHLAFRHCLLKGLPNFPIWDL